MFRPQGIALAKSRRVETLETTLLTHTCLLRSSVAHLPLRQPMRLAAGFSAQHRATASPEDDRRALGAHPNHY